MDNQKAIQVGYGRKRRILLVLLGCQLQGSSSFTLLPAKNNYSKQSRPCDFDERSGIMGRQSRAMRYHQKTFLTAASFAEPLTSTRSINGAYKAKLGKDKTDDQSAISPELIRALDLEPLIEALAQRCGTRRGRLAVKALLGIPTKEVPSAFRRQGNDQDHYNKMMYYRRSKTPRYEATNGNTSEQDSLIEEEVLAPPEPIIQLAKTAQEARDEYSLVSEARTLFLESSIHHPINGVGQPKVTLEKFDPVPPIYPAFFSPWTGQTNVIHDLEDEDERFLELNLNNYQELSSLDLQGILCAEQMAKNILRLLEWSENYDTQSIAPGLTQKVRKCLVGTVKDSLERFLEENVANAIEIVRGGRTLLDPSGNKSFGLRLSSLRFSDLESLRMEEERLRGEMKNEDGNEKIRNEKLQRICDEIAYTEENIKYELRLSIAKAARYLRQGMHVMGRIDVLFARAALGYDLDGYTPIVYNEGVISVQKFVHPVLKMSSATINGLGKDVVPIDLDLSEDDPSLIISGPNGGGKSCALKAFGLAAIMCQTGIPIPVDSCVVNEIRPRVDFFGSVLVDIGDSQDVMAGQSTLMAKLNACSRILSHVTTCKDDDCDKEEPSSFLVLLDEMGSGTDPEAGAAISRAILEQLVDSTGCRIVATTHMPQLKYLPRTDSRFRCASVLLQNEEAQVNGGAGFSLPSFRLSYGTTGESYALGAAARCDPSLPRSVIQKAAEILTSSDNTMDATKYLSIQDAMQNDRELALEARQQAEEFMRDAAEARDAMISVAKQYEAKFIRLENRLQEIMQVMRDSENRDAFDVVGETLSSLQLVKRRALTDADLLAERGLQVVPFSYNLRKGEQVVIVAKGSPWEGEAAVVTDVDTKGIKVTVCLTLGYAFVAGASRGLLPDELLEFSKDDLAIWASADTTNGKRSANKFLAESKRESLSGVDQLFSFMGSINGSSHKSKQVKVGSSNSKFISSRQRKAASKKKK